jgi:uncharacterized protein (DUF1501 family)
MKGHHMNPLLMNPSPIHRRRVLALSWGALTGMTLGSAVPGALWAQAAPQSAGRLVVVFLRGAYDGLSAFVPYADPHYTRLRQSIAIPAPDGTAQTALKLDDTFALHPALSPLMPLWQQGVLAFLPATGLPAPVRSHFEAQHYWEIGQPGKNSAGDGWLNTLAGGKAPQALGVGEANPEILRGAAPVKLVARGQAATRTGALANERTRQALMDLYAGSDTLNAPFQQGTGSRLDTARTLEEAAMMAKTEMQAADNGAPNVAGLRLDARHLATLMRQDRSLRVGFLSAGGWDTHANQGGVTGQLANNLGNLAQALVALRAAFNEPGDVIAVVSEFGRTAAENGSRGTDHGHGNTMVLIGERIAGGRRHGGWEGLAPGQLNDNRDLPVLHDFRAVLSVVLRGTQGVGDAQLAALFPGSPFAGAALMAGDNRLLKDLVRG